MLDDQVVRDALAAARWAGWTNSRQKMYQAAFELFSHAPNDVRWAAAYGIVERWFATSPDERAFWAKIEGHPDDDAPKLVYADWLEERGREADAKRVRHVVTERIEMAIVDQWWIWFTAREIGRTIRGVVNRRLAFAVFGSIQDALLNKHPSARTAIEMRVELAGIITMPERWPVDPAVDAAREERLAAYEREARLLQRLDRLTRPTPATTNNGSWK